MWVWLRACLHVRRGNHPFAHFSAASAVFGPARSAPQSLRWRAIDSTTLSQGPADVCRGTEG